MGWGGRKFAEIGRDVGTIGMEEFGKVGVTKAEYEEWGGERKQWKCQS